MSARSMVNVCVPVFNRYDLLRSLLLSLRESTRQPDACYIINEGGDTGALASAILGSVSVPIHVHTPPAPIGASAVANWFIHNVSDDRVMANDDIHFLPDTIARLVETPGDFVAPRSRQAHPVLGAQFEVFSCCIIRDSCVERVGLFDESISPGYIYFDDCDYGYRMQLAGVEIVQVDVDIIHGHSQSLAAKTPAQIREHHMKFEVAKGNFVRKWGGLPGYETKPPRSVLRDTLPYKGKLGACYD